MAAHRYWRINVTLANSTGPSFYGGSPGVVVAEVEFRESAGGVDVSSTGSVIFSTEKSSFEAINAFDDQTSNPWASGDGLGLPQWVGIDFGAGNEKDIVQVALWTDLFDQPLGPRDFTIEYSDDGSSWTVAQSFSSQDLAAGNENLFNVVPQPPSGIASLTLRHRPFETGVASLVLRHRPFETGVASLVLRHRPVNPSGVTSLTLRHRPFETGVASLVLRHRPVNPSGVTSLTLRHRPFETGVASLILRHQPNATELGSVFSVVLLVGGVDMSARVTGRVLVSSGAGAARLADFTLLPFSGAVDPQQWVKKSVEIDYLTQMGGVQQTRHRLFTGRVNDATYDKVQNVYAFECTDGLQAAIEDVELSHVDTLVGGYYSEAVFNPTESSWYYAQQRMETQAASLDKNRQGALRKWAWAAKVQPDFTFSESDIIHDTLSYTQLSSRELVNSVDIDFKFRYPRKWQREVKCVWLFPFQVIDYLTYGPRIPNRQMFINAIEATGALIKSVNFTEVWPNGTYGGTSFAVADDVREELILGANATLSSRWVQDIVEHYTLRIKNDASIAAFGELKESVTYSVEAPEEDAYEVPLHQAVVSSSTAAGQASSDAYKPPEVGSIAVSNGSDYYLDSSQRAIFDEAIKTAIAVAEVDILSAHHSNESTFECLLNPRIDIGATVTVNTATDLVTGVVVEMAELIDFDEGSAITTLSIATFSPSVANQPSDAVAVPMSPDVSPDVAAPDITLKTYVGGEQWLPGVPGEAFNLAVKTTDEADESFRGLLTNYIHLGANQPGTVLYPFEFRVEYPEVESSLRDEQSFAQSQTFNVAIPQENFNITI